MAIQCILYSFLYLYDTHNTSDNAFVVQIVYTVYCLELIASEIV